VVWIPLSRSKSPGRFTHLGVKASGSCSGERGNVLAVWTYCYVAVCTLQARSARRREALRRPQREKRGGAYCGGRPPTACNFHKFWLKLQNVHTSAFLPCSPREFQLFASSYDMRCMPTYRLFTFVTDDFYRATQCVSAVFAVAQCPSVRPSRWWIVSRRLKITSYLLLGPVSHHSSFLTSCADTQFQG